MKLSVVNSLNKKFLREFPEGTVVRTQYFHCWGLGSIPGRGTKILQRKAQSKKKKNLLKVSFHDDRRQLNFLLPFSSNFLFQKFQNKIPFTKIYKLFCFDRCKPFLYVCTYKFLRKHLKLTDIKILDS